MSLQLTLDLKEFLDFASYNGLFSYVEMSPSIANQIALADPNKTLCVCEPVNEIFTHVWYPIDSWIAECKRRKYIADTEIEDKARQEKQVHQATLKQQLMAAALCENESEVNRIMELMKNG